jgi:hypothetical protein
MSAHKKKHLYHSLQGISAIGLLRNLLPSEMSIFSTQKKLTEAITIKLISVFVPDVSKTQGTLKQEKREKEKV